MFTGADDAWGGFAAKYAENLRDEFGKMAIWSWGIEAAQGKGSRMAQSLRMLNLARTTYKMSACTSMFIPLSVPAAPLPKYVHLQRDSEWHSSALLAAAVESVTLPSRLRFGNCRQGTLGILQAALNVNGSQTIAELQCSIIDPDDYTPRSFETSEQTDGRLPSSLQPKMTEEAEHGATESDLDIDLSGGDDQVSQAKKNRHTFGTIRGLRGADEAAENADDEDEDITYAKKRRRFAGLTVIERCAHIIFHFHGLHHLTILDTNPHSPSLFSAVSPVSSHSDRN